MNSAEVKNVMWGACLYVCVKHKLFLKLGTVYGIRVVRRRSRTGGGVTVDRFFFG